VSTKVFRSLGDFMRFGIDVDVICYCGHKRAFPASVLVSWFSNKGWPMGIHAALRYFRCSKCGSRPKCIGPPPR
jgi:hypothetical protein